MLGQKLLHKQAQSVGLSKQMQQSLKMLQMTSLELADYLLTEVQENPFVEMEESLASLEDAPPIANDDESDDTQWQAESYLRYERAGGGMLEGAIVAGEASLKEHLVTQINIAFVDVRSRFIAYYLVDSLDENGYLRYTPIQLAQRLKCDVEWLSTVLDRLKKMDPAGIFAYDLKECLKLQLEQNAVSDPAAYVIVEHLEEIARRKFSSVIRKLRIEEAKVLEYLTMIKRLNPKPARSFSFEDASTRIADVIVSKGLDGGWILRLNPSAFPSVFVNSVYFDNVYHKTNSTEDKKFCTQKLQSANWLLRSVKQRADTILNIANHIVAMQNDFLNFGINYLKPMKLADIATLAGVHESTVSRISNKYLLTPLGMFELKYFFSNSLQSTLLENNISTRAVKNRIKMLVEGEKNTAVLRDEEIVKLLGEEGIAISRRTVAKYRAALNIKPSHLRKCLL